MTVPLLPRPKDPKDDWGAQKEGFFQINVTDVRERLALAEHLAPKGIASPLAQLHFVNWMLENQESARGREAAEVLRLVVLLQYLGHLEARRVPIASSGELGWLGPLLEKSWGAGEPKSLVLWKIRGLGEAWDGQVFAGSHPAIPFFPGAAFYPDTVPGETERLPAWHQVRDALIVIHGPQAKMPLLDDQGEVTDADLAASLLDYLGGFTKAGPQGLGWVEALKGWLNRLSKLAEGRKGQQAALLGISIELMSSTGKTIAVPLGFYIGASPREAWICPECERGGKSWINFPGQQVVAGDTLHVVCSQHARQNIEKGDGVEVGPEQYGAYSAPDRKLYVWVDDVARPVGSKRVGIQGSPGSDGAVVYRFNRQELVVKGRLVSRDQVIQKTVAWMARRERAEPGPVDVPVSGEYAALVRKWESDPVNRCWKIEFNGLRDPVTVPYPPDQETLWRSSTIVIWPPGECPGWSIDYVAASTPRSDRAGFRLLEEAKGGGLVRSPVFRSDALYRTKTGRVRYIEVGEGLTEDSFRSMGLLAVKRISVSQEDAGARGQIVFDFGTSNSAVLWHVPGAKEPDFVLSGEDPARPVLFPTFQESDYANLQQSVRGILSSWNREETVRPFLPSLHGSPDPHWKGAEPFIPPRRLSIVLLADPASAARLASGLKWMDWDAQGIQVKIESFIELLLLPAFWELRAGGCGSADLTATYPLAFGEARKNAYEKILGTVTKRLSDKTGLRVESSPILSVSESAAASSLLPQTNVTHVVALDNGGGTTDLAIHIGVAGTMNKEEVGTVLAADSIEYAGRDFLRAVVVAYGPELLFQMFPRVQKGLSPPAPVVFGGTDAVLEAYVVTLEALLQDRGVEGLYELLKYVPQDARPADMILKYTEMILRWEALLAGLLLYIRRMVEGCVAQVPSGKPVSVAFNLFGLGWELLRILGGDIRRPVTSVLEPRFCALCEEIGRARAAAVSAEVHAIPEMQERKTAVVRGAARITAGGDPGAAGGVIPPSTHALTANIRRTFAGMTIFDAQGQVAVNASARVEDVSDKPNWLGDPGYGNLLDELFEATPEVIPGTRQPLRSRVKELLLNSAAYRAQFRTQDIRKNLIDRGQDDLNRGETWPAGNINPTRSLLAGFLTSVWRPVWSNTRL